MSHRVTIPRTAFKWWYHFECFVCNRHLIYAKQDFRDHEATNHSLNCHGTVRTWASTNRKPNLWP